MQCDYCGGKGKYDPFVGPTTTCPKCGGTGQLSGSCSHTPASGGFVPPGQFDPVMIRLHLINKKSPFAADEGKWRLFSTKNPGKTISLFDNFDAEYLDFRLLACDYRDKPRITNIVYDDDPAGYNQLADAAKQKGAGFAVGPDIKVKIGSLECWWHAYSKVQEGIVLKPGPSSPGGLFHVSQFGCSYEFKSVEVQTTKIGSYWIPAIRKH